MPLPVLYHGSQDKDFLNIKFLKDKIYDLFIGIPDHFFSGHIRISIRSAGIKQSEKVIYLGCGAYCGSGILVGRFLLNADNRRQACYFVHIGSFHISQELTGVS